MRRALTDRCDGRGEVRRAPVFEIVAIDRSDDNVAQSKCRDGRSHSRRFSWIAMVGASGLDVAEGASPGASVAHDHDGGVPLGTALANIGTASLRADGVETVRAEDRLFRVKGSLIRHPDAKPRRLRAA